MHAKNLNKFAASLGPIPSLDPLLAPLPRSAMPACLHIAHTQCGTTFNYVKQAVRLAGWQAGNTSQWHHQKRISVIRAGAERAGEMVTGTVAVGGVGGNAYQWQGAGGLAAICSVILWLYRRFLLLLLSACCLFVYFSLRFSRGKLQGRTSERGAGAGTGAAAGTRHCAPVRAHATTVSSNFQLESFLAPNEHQFPLPPPRIPSPRFLPLWQSAASVANAFCSCCTHTQKRKKETQKSRRQVSGYYRCHNHKNV